MIVEYYRPETLKQASELIARAEPLTLPLAGGTTLSRQGQNPAVQVAVVDMQRLGLNEIRKENGLLMIGAAVTLQHLADHELTPAALAHSIRQEVGLNARNQASVGGMLVSCDGRSPFVTTLLALDPRLVWYNEEETQTLGDYLALRGKARLDSTRGRLMTEIRVLLNAKLRYEAVARSPLDRPIVCAASAQWPSGRSRLTLGGWGNAPILALDGPEAGGAAAAARNAYIHAEDTWASAEYRSATASRLAQRLFSNAEAQEESL